MQRMTSRVEFNVILSGFGGRAPRRILKSVLVEEDILRGRRANLDSRQGVLRLFCEFSDAPERVGSQATRPAR